MTARQSIFLAQSFISRVVMQARRPALALWVFLLASAQLTMPRQLEAQLPTITVGPNVHVSQSRATTDHFEVIVDADPEHPGRMVACSHIPKEKIFTDVVNYVSDDNGRTW